ncbi:MAG: ATP-dependent DNA helicase RecG [Chloroflexi bacterium]|nr:ATP-dependent DNA helicase RecG [Chloroflexota bacterium]
MSIDTSSIRKILEFERKKGYADSVVVGGLDRFLANWSGKALESVTDRKLLARFRKLGLITPNYALLNPQQRKEWIEAVLAFLPEIEKIEAEAAENKTSKPESPSKTMPQEVPAWPSRNRKSVVSALSRPSIDSPVTIISGISTRLAEKFEKLGVRTVRDLLYFFPHRHLDYSQRKTISQLVEGEEQTIIANVWEAHLSTPGGRRSTEATVGDETGNVRIIWFNNPYLAKRLAPNSKIVISGKVSVFRGQRVFESPEWEFVEDKDTVHTGRLVPVYSLTEGLHPRQVRQLMKRVVDQWAGQLEDFLPAAVRQRCKLLGLPEAVSQAHYPENATSKDSARVRLAFDELFLLQLGVLGKKREWQESQPGNPFNVEVPGLDTFLKSLPFTLTSAQQRVLKELLADLRREKAMSRLLQGEVGSGKTIVATAALLVAAANGFQGAFMAPTEILAEQHFSGICQLLSAVASQTEADDCLRSFSGLLPRPLTVALLVGDVRQVKKRGLQKRILDGEVDIVIGTHAIIQKAVEFHRLGLAVIDEQHRFGVEQRAILRQKGANPHLLVMTATPIPRTLALTLFGDLDLSVIDELPPGRQTIKTKWLRPEQRESAYSFMRKQVGLGRQAFIICPLVEESDAVQAKAATAEYERLSSEVFPDLRLGLLHGRMSGKDKDEVMRLFRCGELDILVSTPVVEVGIDVPNATVMLVESADRFGLSQLHQFRGRVGRGTEQSYCMLLAENPSEVSSQRLGAIENIQNGFALAEEDLKLRGPGDFFGTRQSGLPDLRMAKLSDIALLELARKEAIKLFEVDPLLEKREHRPLAKELVRVWHKEAEMS